MIQRSRIAGTPLPVCLWLFTAAAAAQVPPPAAEERPIQDNSFLLEEAYNQERGTVQHIFAFSRMWNSREWVSTFTQEWPGLRNPRHQFSYTLIGMHAAGSEGAGLGDVALNYRYQVAGSGDSRLAFAPRLSLLVPTGDVAQGRGSGAAGLQTNLPLSVILSRRLVTHWNAGATFVRHAHGPGGIRASTVGYNLGQSFIFAPHPRINILLETVANRFQSVDDAGSTPWGGTTYISPGIRWSHNLSSGLQIVPGLAIPVGIGRAGQSGVFLYLSFEGRISSIYGR